MQTITDNSTALIQSLRTLLQDTKPASFSKTKAIDVLKQIGTPAAIDVIAESFTDSDSLNGNYVGTYAIARVAEMGSVGVNVLLKATEAHLKQERPTAKPAFNTFDLFRESLIRALGAVSDNRTLPLLRDTFVLSIQQERFSGRRELAKALRDFDVDQLRFTDSEIAALYWYSGDNHLMVEMGGKALPFLESKLPDSDAFRLIGLIGDVASISAVNQHLMSHPSLALACIEKLVTPKVLPEITQSEVETETELESEIVEAVELKAPEKPEHIVKVYDICDDDVAKLIAEFEQDGYAVTTEQVFVTEDVAQVYIRFSRSRSNYGYDY